MPAPSACSAPAAAPPASRPDLARRSGHGPVRRTIPALPTVTTPRHARGRDASGPVAVAAGSVEEYRDGVDATPRVSGGPPSTSSAIATRSLTKRFGDALALDRLELDVRVGEVFGFLGPNGAGKTTTIRLLLDLLRPTSGTATVLGLDPRRDGVELRARVGYLPGDVDLPARLSGRHHLEDHAAVRGRSLRHEIGELADRLGHGLHIGVERGRELRACRAAASVHEAVRAARGWNGICRKRSERRIQSPLRE